MSTENPNQELANKNITQIIYGLYAAAILGIPTNIVGIIMNYIKREDVAGTLYESHFRWQMRTFWFTLLWGVVGTILIFALGLGFLVLIVLFIWYVYRIVKGWLRLTEGKAMYT
jgi:uncharacterized membrane protein